MKDTLITASGIIRNRTKPRVGVLSVHSVNSDLLDEITCEGIDLTFEEIETEVTEKVKSEHPEADENEIENMVIDALEEYDTNGPFLFGAWKKVDGKYEIDTSGEGGEYAGTYSPESGNICVEWSKHTTPCRCTSPCYVMADGSGPCGDLNSEGDDVIAFTLPNDCLNKENNQ